MDGKAVAGSYFEQPVDDSTKGDNSRNESIELLWDEKQESIKYR